MRNSISTFLLVLSCAAGQVVAPVAVPNTLRAPDGQKLIFHAHGAGDQIYTCHADGASYAWKLKAPEARLFNADGQQIGRHFAGPTWESKDGSRVTGRAVATVPSPDPGAVPWLLLTAIGREGHGVMDRVLSIQRLETNGGKAPEAGCDASHIGAETRIPYQAEYYFFGSR